MARADTLARMTRSTAVRAGIGALALTLLLAACTAQPAPTEPTTPETSVTDDSSAPSPTPTVSPAVELASCDDLLDDAGEADLAADHLAPIDFEPQSWDYPRLVGMHEGGVVCKWGGGGDVIVVVGQLAMDEPTWDAARAELEAEGYVPDDAVIEGFLDGPDGQDESYASRGFAWRDGILYYASYPGILESVPAFQR